MLLRELIFQDLFGVSRPVRLEVSGQITAMALPPGVTSEHIQDLLLSVLYPKDTPHSIRMELARSDEAKIAALFEHRKRIYRVLRQADAETLRLQVKESAGWRDLAVGSLGVDDRLAQSLGRPDFDVFWAINLWRFERDPAEATAFDIEAVDPKIRDVILKYRLAVAVERVEDEIKSTEGRIQERSKELGQGAALEEKLRKAKEKLVDIEVSELSDADLELLKQKDTLIGDFDLQLQRLEEQEDTERHQIELVLPDKPIRSPYFWGGLVAGVAAVVAAALDPGIRWVALTDVVGFGVVAWTVFTYFEGMERASVHQVRLESIKRRINQVREELVSTQERINHVLIHAGVRDAKEMSERVAKADQLREMIDKMQRRVEELRRDAGYMAAFDDVEKQRKRLAELQAERRELPQDTLSSFQLENDLESMGIEPQLVLEERPSSSAAEESGNPIARLIEAAQSTGQWDSVELYPKTRKMWGKICGHMLGDKFSDVSLTDNGNLRIGQLDPEQIDLWRRTRPSEYEVLLRSFAIALQVGADERSRRGVFESIVIGDPAQYLTAVQVKKLQDVFASAAQKSEIVILSGG